MIETEAERTKRLAWMERHLGVPFCEMRQRSQAAYADTCANRKIMLANQPSQGPLNFKYVDDLTARIQARRDKQK